MIEVCHLTKRQIGVRCSHLCFFLVADDRFVASMANFQAGGKAGKDSGKSKAKAVSRSARAGLQVCALNISFTIQRVICGHN